MVDNPRRKLPARWRRMRGFTFAEMLVVVAIVGLMAGVGAPFIIKTLRRQRVRAAAQEIYSLVLATRMQAVKRNQHVVMFVDHTNATNPAVTTWAENLPLNYVQDTLPVPEPTISRFELPRYIHFSYAPDGPVDGDNAVAFDTYLSNTALVNRIIFRGDGTLVPPQEAYSAQPLKPDPYTATVPSGSVDCISGCRGIFIADNEDTGDLLNRNVLRISVDDFGQTGKGSLMKWAPSCGGCGGNPGEVNFVPSAWHWVN